MKSFVTSRDEGRIIAEVGAMPFMKAILKTVQRTKAAKILVYNTHGGER